MKKKYLEKKVKALERDQDAIDLAHNEQLRKLREDIGQLQRIVLAIDSARCALHDLLPF